MDSNLRARIEDELDAAYEGLAGLLARVHEASGNADPKESVELVVDAFLDRVDLPWGIPTSLLRPALCSALLETAGLPRTPGPGSPA